MKKLLLATDLSPRPDLALQRAMDLARMHGAALSAVYVVDEDLPPALAEVVKSGAERIIRERLAALPDGDKVAVTVRSGRPANEILRHAADEQAELIVLGVHRTGGLKDMFRGTTAERVIRTGNVPVLVVKAAAEGPYRRVVIGTDFSVHARRAMQLALRLASGAELYLVHAFLVPFAGILRDAQTRQQVASERRDGLAALVGEEMRAFLAGFEGGPPEVYQIVREGMAQDVILREIVARKADLVALGTHGRTGVAHAVLGSVAADLLSEAPCDVLVARAW